VPVTADQLIKIMPYAKARAAEWLTPLNLAMADFEIDRPRRMAAFLAQVAHESGELRYTRELADGNAYEGRADLGNTVQGDGRRYKGRGLIQITGRENYAICSQAILGDPAALLDNPDLLEEPVLAARSAAWYWQSRNLNALADQINTFQTITRRINGGLSHYDQRVMYWERAKLVLGC